MRAQESDPDLRNSASRRKEDIQKLGLQFHGGVFAKHYEMTEKFFQLVNTYTCYIQTVFLECYYK